MMQVRRQDDRGGLVSSLHLLWEERRWCDGLLICRDGAVPFASLVLASSLWPVNTALEVSLWIRPTEELASLKI